MRPTSRVRAPPRELVVAGPDGARRAFANVHARTPRDITPRPTGTMTTTSSAERVVAKGFDTDQHALGDSTSGHETAGVRTAARALPAALAMLVAGAGCAGLWPTVISTSSEKGGPLFEASSPFGESGRIDGALCSLLSLGPDAALAVRSPEGTADAVSVEEACREEPPGVVGRRGRTARLVQVTTAYGPVAGYLYTVRPATGLVVAFSGLGMPAAGWINEHFAEAGARRGQVTFAPVRDEAARQIAFDPLREAKRAVDAAGQIAAACRIGAPSSLGFVGISLGGLEALLAGREAGQRGLPAHAAALDPLLDVGLAATSLDAAHHSLAGDPIRAFFRRILVGRYQEPPSVSFRDVMRRTGSHPEDLSDMKRDAPTAWLCQADRASFALFLSDGDPALGDAQRAFAVACGIPVRHAHAPGHAPLACRLELFEEMLEAVR